MTEGWSRISKVKGWEVHEFKTPTHPWRMKFDETSFIKRFTDKMGAFELKWELEEKDYPYEYKVLQKWK